MSGGNAHGNAWKCMVMNFKKALMACTHREEAHFNISQKAPNRSHQMENTRVPWKKLRELKKKNNEKIRITSPILRNESF